MCYVRLLEGKRLPVLLGITLEFFLPSVNSSSFLRLCFFLRNFLCLIING